jgi:hypothetical protein
VVLCAREHFQGITNNLIVWYSALAHALCQHAVPASMTRAKRCWTCLRNSLLQLLACWTFKNSFTAVIGKTHVVRVHFREHSSHIGSRRWPRLLAESKRLELDGNIAVGYYYANVSLV